MKQLLNRIYIIGFMILLSVLYGVSNFFFAKTITPVAFLPPLIFSALALYLLKNEGITPAHAGWNLKFNKTLLTLMLCISFTTLNYVFCFTYFKEAMKAFVQLVGYYKYQYVNPGIVLYFILLNICAELFFRVYMLNALHKHFRTRYTIIIGAGLSTLTLFYFFVRHIDATLALIVFNFFITYVFMNWLYMKYRNLLGIILGHVAMDVIMFGLITEFKFY